MLGGPSHNAWLYIDPCCHGAATCVTPAEEQEAQLSEEPSEEPSAPHQGTAVRLCPDCFPSCSPPAQLPDLA